MIVKRKNMEDINFVWLFVGLAVGFAIGAFQSN